MVTATFRFHHELNDFLPPQRRAVEFSVRCARNATTKHMIEALGVPHTEVELILVQDEPAGLDRLLRDGDRVAVYPGRDARGLTSHAQLRDWPAGPMRFVADAHLGGLARLLRMAGFDTVYRNDWQDRQIVDLAIQEGRIVLTRDRDLLMRRDLSHGCYLHALKPRQQLIEIIQRLNLSAQVRPFSRCLECNAPLQAIDKSEVAPRLPPGVQQSQHHFTCCKLCGRIFWPGSHWQRMRRLLDSAIGPGTPTADA